MSPRRRASALLTPILAIFALWPAAGQAAEPAGVGVASKVDVYVDNDGNEIVTPITAVDAALSEDVSLSAHAAVDVMTCASVDVVSAATPKGYFQETRQEYGASLAWSAKVVQLTLGGVYSHENDYQSMTATVGLSTELAQRNSNLALGYSFVDSNVGRAHDPLFERDLDSHALTLTYTQTLTPRLIGQVATFVGILDGFQSSPYRMARLRAGTSTPENVPDFRYRQSVVARLKWALANAWFLSGDYRFYGDSWGLQGHTLEASVVFQATSWLSLRLRDRLHRQSGTSFYADRYDSLHRYMTSDRELGPFVANLVGLRLEAAPLHLGSSVELALDAKVDFTWSRFSEFERLPERLMLVSEAGARLDF